MFQVTITEDIRLSGTALEDKAVWVQSDQEVIVFGVNKETFSTDAYQALPVIFSYILFLVCFCFCF